MVQQALGVPDAVAVDRRRAAAFARLEFLAESNGLTDDQKSYWSPDDDDSPPGQVIDAIESLWADGALDALLCGLPVDSRQRRQAEHMKVVHQIVREPWGSQRELLTILAETALKHIAAWAQSNLRLDDTH